VDKPIYVSLVGPFLNFYALVPGANTEEEARLMCATDRRLTSLWCSVYDRAGVDRCIEEFGGQIIELYEGGMEYDPEALRHLRAGSDPTCPDPA